MINMELYRIFYTVAINQNITKASEELNISQPAVTKHIKNLEDDLGVILFNRTRKGVTLTPIGQKLFLEIKKALTTIDNIENEIKICRDNNCGTIRIGISTTLVRLLMDYINTFYKKYPNIKIEINTDTTKDNIKLLQDGLLDLIICKLPKDLSKDLNFIKLGDSSYEFVANKELYDKIKQPITLLDLTKYPILLQKKPSNSYSSVKKFFKENNLEIDSKLNIGSSSLLSDFTKIGYGIGYITKLYIEKELENKELFIIETIPKTPKISYGIITLKNNILSTSCNNFINHLLTFSKKSNY